MKTKYRASKIIIENLRSTSEPWVHFIMNQVIEDDNGKVINEIPRFDRISKKFSKVMDQFITFIDPITKKEYTISGYGVEKIFEQFVKNLVKEKYGISE